MYYLRVIIVMFVVAFVGLVNLFLFSLSCAAFHRPQHIALGSRLQQHKQHAYHTPIIIIIIILNNLIHLHRSLFTLTHTTAAAEAAPAEEIAPVAQYAQSVPTLMSMY